MRGATRPRLAQVATLVVVVAAVATLATAVTGPASAQTTTPPDYYSDNSSNVDTGGWLAGMQDASLEDTIAMSVRVGPYVIGTGAAQGGVGQAGVLLTGALLGAIVMGTGLRARVGPVGGAVFVVATTFSLATVGTGPGWLYALALFAFGLVVAVALIRALR